MAGNIKERRNILIFGDVLRNKKSENNETVFFPALPAELLSHGCDRLDSNQ